MLTALSSIHKIVLDDLGVKQIATVVGGSMGGMLALEYAFFGKDYVRSIIPMATSARCSAWCIGWSEAQRQSIYSDPKYESGYYPFNDPPATGLGASRMTAILTHRSHNSFESRFGRNVPDPSKRQNINGFARSSTPCNEHWAVHNDGHKGEPPFQATSTAPTQSRSSASQEQYMDPQFTGTKTFIVPSNTGNSSDDKNRIPTYFSAQSYLRYQGERFVKRFDTNCYIAITRKLDTHDVCRHRVRATSEDPVHEVLSQIKQPALVLGIESDGLFIFEEQKEIAAGIPDSRLKRIDSTEGHDAFLLQFEQVNRYIIEFFREVLPDIMARGGKNQVADSISKVTKSSTFGEAEVEDTSAW